MTNSKLIRFKYISGAWQFPSRVNEDMRVAWYLNESAPLFSLAPTLRVDTPNFLSYCRRPCRLVKNVEVNLERVRQTRAAVFHDIRVRPCLCQ